MALPLISRNKRLKSVFKYITTVAWLLLNKRIFFFTSNQLPFLLLIDDRKGVPKTFYLGDHLCSIESQSDKEDLNAEIFLGENVDSLPSTSMCPLSGGVCGSGSYLTGSQTRGPWLAEHRKSSWRRLATSQCWACRRWGCQQLRIPHPGSVSSQPPRIEGDAVTYMYTHTHWLLIGGLEMMLKKLLKRILGSCKLSQLF